NKIIQEKLTEIDLLKDQLSQLRPLNEQQIKNLKIYFDMQLTYNSNAIEGSTLDLSETKIILLQGITIGGKSMREHLEAINHKYAIDYIEDIVKRGDKEIKLVDILGLHRIILREIDDENAGKYRKYDVYVMQKNSQKYIFPEPKLVPLLMENFDLWMKENVSLHPVILACESHYRFVTIHPFIDGNGRCARLLMNLVLMQNGYSSCIVKNEQRKEYLDSIEAAQNKGNMDPFYVLMIDSLKESLEIYIKTIKDNIIWK
ncbi:Fic family protein, partial [bacterium]